MSYTKGPWEWVDYTTDEPVDLDKFDCEFGVSLRTVEHFRTNTECPGYMQCTLPKFIITAYDDDAGVEPNYIDNMKVLMLAPLLADYVQAKANEGDAEAKKLVDQL